MREFGIHTTWDDVQDTTIDEAIMVLSKYVNPDGSDWSARPHFAKACQMAIEALEANLRSMQRMKPRGFTMVETLIQDDEVRQAEQVLVDNGIEADEASIVLQAIGYVLLGRELYEGQD